MYRALSEAHIAMKIIDLFYERALEKRGYSAQGLQGSCNRALFKNPPRERRKAR